MLVAAPFERSSEVVVCDALLVNPGMVSLMIMIKAMSQVLQSFGVSRRFPWLPPIGRGLAGILVACFRKIAHMSSSAARYIAIFMVTACRWPLFVIHRLHALLAACLCWISMGIKAIHHIVQRKPVTKAQVPIITITPAENDETSACESVDISALLEEISDRTTGVEPLLGNASPISEYCPKDRVIVESQIDELLLDASHWADRMCLPSV